MNALQHNSVSKDNKTKKTLITSVSVAALAVGLSFPIGSAVLSNAQSGDSQMGGAPGASSLPVSPEQQKKDDARTVVLNAYNAQVGSNAQYPNRDAVLKANASDAFYTHYLTDRMDLNYDPITHAQNVPQSFDFGTTVLGDNVAYVPITLYAGYGESRQVLSNVIVVVDSETNKITAITGEYK